ncbi:MAG TPA: flippase [Burkholderiales bacterium]|nr:flippase [Burkholderiales bacterium]
MNAYWIRYLPGFVRTRLDGRHRLQAIVSNSGWLFVDRVLRMAAGLLVGVWVARYLGPSQYGLWNYAVAFAALVGAFASLGLDNIVVRELVRHPQRLDRILGTAFVLKLISGVAALAVAIVAIAIVRTGDTLAMWLVGISAAGFIFQSVNVVSFYFQAKVRSKFTVYATNGAFLLSAIAKVVMLVAGAPLLAFAIAGLAEVVLSAIFLVVAYKLNHLQMRSWRFDRTEAKVLLRESWPLMLSGMAIIVYTRIDQILIGQILDEHAVGLYSAAVRISEVWYFVPVAIATSVFPSILENKKRSEALYLHRLQSLLDVLAIMSVAVALLVTFAGDFIIAMLYGAAYADAAAVLKIHVWTGVFVGLTAAASGWFLTEGLQTLALRRTLVGAVASISLNVLLIPRFGIVGAAWAGLVAQAICVFSNAATAGSRKIFVMQLKAFQARTILRRVVP